jgi:hypothetical protein
MLSLFDPLTTKKTLAISPGLNFVAATRECRLKQFQAEFDENQND